jgi:hypothetical protein
MQLHVAAAFDGAMLSDVYLLRLMVARICIAVTHKALGQDGRLELNAAMASPCCSGASCSCGKFHPTNVIQCFPQQHQGVFPISVKVQL